MATACGDIEVVHSFGEHADGSAASAVAPGCNEHPESAPPSRWRLTSLLALTSVAFGALFIVFAILYATAGASAGTPSPPLGTMDPISVDRVRVKLLGFVNSLSSHQQEHIYYSDMSKMAEQWLMCPIVQQCQEPLYGLSTGDISPQSYGKFIGALSEALDDGDDKTLLLQLAMNDLLGQVQYWATECAGKCVQLDESYGNPAMLPKAPTLEAGILQFVPQSGMTYQECFAASVNMTLVNDYTWLCNETPVLLFGELDTSTGRYKMNNVFEEPCVHPRTKEQNFVSVYGSLLPAYTGAFGFRFTGHHFDIGLEFVNDGSGTVLGVSKYPQFIGHNPLNVMDGPSLTAVMREHEEQDHPLTAPGGPFSLWNLFSGAIPFPDAVSRTIALARLLPSDAYAPLDRFVSNSTIGGMSYAPPYTNILDVPHITLRDASRDLFDAVVGFFDTLLTDTSWLRDEFWATGKLTWTSESKFDLPKTIEQLTTSSRFLYVQVQTDSHYCFGMVNLMFTYVTLQSPSNHLHMFCSPVSFLTNPQHFWRQQDPDCAGHHS